MGRTGDSEREGYNAFETPCTHVQPLRGGDVFAGENFGHRRRHAAENGDGHAHGDRAGHQRQRAETVARLPAGVARTCARQKGGRGVGHRRRRPFQEQRAAVHVQDGPGRGRRDPGFVQGGTRPK